MDVHYYIGMLQELFKQQLFTEDELKDKDVLILGFFGVGANILAMLLKPFQEAGAKITYMPLFNENLAHRTSLPQLEEALEGKKYDFIFLVEGLEQEPHFVKSAIALANSCLVGGKLLLFVQTPDATEEASNAMRRLEATWAYDIQDIESLFPGFSLLFQMRTAPAYLLAVKLQKKRDAKLLRPMAFSRRLKCHVSEKKGLQAGFFQEFQELDNIGVTEVTDKCRYRHNYLPKYEFFLRGLKEKPLRLLELGVFTGSSARMWKRFFPQATIYGIDIDDSCRAYAEERLEIRIGDLAKDEVLESLKEIRPHIIIDDASHIWSHQIKALLTLFFVLPSGGIYILEDFETSFHPELFETYGDFSIDAYTVIERITRVAASRKPCTKEPFAAEITAVGMATELVATMLSSCILIKR